MNLNGFDSGEVQVSTLADKWIFSRLHALIQSVDEAYKNYDFAAMTRSLYHFFWNEFCDWYIEFSKGRLSEQNDPTDRLACQRNLVFILECACKILHPIMPFVTEEIYDSLYDNKADDDMLIASSWPDSSDFDKYRNETCEALIEKIICVISAARSTRARYGIFPKEKLNVSIKTDDQNAELILSQDLLIKRLGNIDALNAGSDVTKPQSSSISVTSDLEIYVDLTDLVDMEAEIARLKKKLADAQKDFAKLDKKLSNEGFLSKAAPEIIEKDKAKHSELKDIIERLNTQLDNLS